MRWKKRSGQAVADHTKRTDGQCTRFELRACLRAIFTRVIEIYSSELSKSVPELADEITKYFADKLRKQLDAIDNTTDEFMTVEQAAELVTIGKQSIRRWVQKNQVGEYDPVERRYLVSRRRLRNYLRDRRGGGARSCLGRRFCRERHQRSSHSSPNLFQRVPSQQTTTLRFRAAPASIGSAITFALILIQLIALPDLITM
jgi:excisionase family DNA binding protein